MENLSESNFQQSKQLKIIQPFVRYLKNFINTDKIYDLPIDFSGHFSEIQRLVKVKIKEEEFKIEAEKYILEKLSENNFHELKQLIKIPKSDRSFKKRIVFLIKEYLQQRVKFFREIKSLVKKGIKYNENKIKYEDMMEGAENYILDKLPKNNWQKLRMCKEPSFSYLCPFGKSA